MPSASEKAKPSRCSAGDRLPMPWAEETGKAVRLQALIPNREGLDLRFSVAPARNFAPGGNDDLQLEEFAQAAGLGAADRNLGLLAIIHTQLIAALEPGHNFLYVVDVHHEGAMGSPENRGIEQLKQLFDRTALGMTFECGRHNGDDAFFNRSETDILLVNQEEPVMRLQNNLAAAGAGRLPVAVQSDGVMHRAAHPMA